MEYRPGDLLEIADESDPSSSDKRSLLILNQPLEDFKTFRGIWHQASNWICADGGANRLYELFSAGSFQDRPLFLPTGIVGDLDSLRDDVRDYYASKGVPVHKDPDQYSTDFGKAMRYIASQKEQGMDVQEVIVLGSLSGRVDHGIGLLHELLREKTRNPSLPLWFFSESSITFILEVGVNKIYVPLDRPHFTPNIGILPIYGPATISTTGLEWDVTDWPTKMGEQVSTSNHIKKDVVTVTTDGPVLFTLERR